MLNKLLIVEFLLGTRYVNPNIGYQNHKDGVMITPLYTASRNGYLRIVNLLLKHKNIDVNIGNGLDNKTALYVAAREGHEAIVELLLDVPGIIIDKSIRNGSTPLMAACARNRHNIVILLINEGANLNAKNKWNQTALFFSIFHKNSGICLYILKNYSKKIKFDLRLFNMIIKGGMHTCIQYILHDLNLFDDKISLKSKDSKGRTPLFIAVYYRQYKIVKVLLKYLENSKWKLKDVINIKDKHGRTILWISLRYKYYDIIELLLQYTDTNMISRPFATLTKHSEYNIYGNEIKFNNDDIQSPFFIACQYCFNSDILTLLINKLSSYDVLCRTIETKQNAIYYCCKYGNQVALNILLTTFKEFNINDTNIHGETGLYIACKNGHYNIIKYLLDNYPSKIDINKKDTNNRTPLFISIVEQKYDIVKLLLSMPNITKSLNQKIIDGNYPIHVAIVTRNERIITELLKQTNINLNITDGNGITPLILAKQMGLNNIVSQISKTINVGQE